MVRSFIALAGLLLGLAAWPLLATSSQDAGAYLGQRLPGSGPELFAPGIVNTGLPTRDITIAPDGRAAAHRAQPPAVRGGARDARGVACIGTLNIA
jgi:hypothetical protein